MDAPFWQERWRDGRTGFHQSRVNTRLMRYWPSLPLAPGDAVLVPLCGKSLDMLWLHEQGHPVLGVELSEIAVRDFFEGNDLRYARTDSGAFTQFAGQGSATGLNVLVGDFFELTEAQCAHVRGCFDRASLIALPEGLREAYARQLCQLLPDGAVSLLLTIDYDATKMKGPPFPVPDALVYSLFEQHCVIDELEFFSGPERLGNLSDRGLETLEERVYRLQRQPRN